jgi:plasmid stabilization system protein ParE
MPFAVILLRRAQADVDRIYQWLSTRSATGASHWYAAFAACIAELRRDPHSCAAAPESQRLRLNVQQRLFKTRHGRTYRVLFLIANDEVRVLRVRGPGQSPVKRRDIL